MLLESIRVSPVPDGDTVEIRSDRPFPFVTYTLTNPDRLVIDPVERGIRTSLAQTGRLDGQVVRSWRIFPQGPGTPAGSVDYVELLLAEPAQHRLESVSELLRVQVRPKRAGLPQEQLLPGTGQEPPLLSDLPGPAAPPPPPSERLIPDEAPSGVWSLARSLEFGLSRHRPVRVARQEVELAQMKVKEARRALYPTATLKFSWTEGTASEVDFTEYTTGMQLEQPLYHSGRLIETFRQSLVNLQVAEKKQTKVKSDYSLELAQEYYQFIGAKVGRAAQGNLVVQTEDFLKRVQTRFAEGLLTRLEVLNVEAQVNQARFQKATAENDEILARIKFLARLALGPEAVVEVPGAFEAPSIVPVDLEEALRLAAQYRPDIQVNSLLVKFHEYEERIAKAKGKWKVDFSSFAGSSAAAFETEPLDAGEDYFLGLKATRNWGANSTSASVNQTKTSPRLGQTTRTDSLVYSAEMGILDQLQQLTEVKQAQVNLEKARRDLEDVKNSVFQEVQEATIGYNKARLQLEYADQRIAFREEQVKILEAQASLNEALPSQVLEAIMKLTEERVGKAQALSSYYVALAKLNKAIGLPGHY